MPYNNSPVKNEMTKTVKVFDKKTGKTTTLTQKDGKYYKAGQLVQLTSDQSPVTAYGPIKMDHGPKMMDQPSILKMCGSVRHGKK